MFLIYPKNEDDLTEQQYYYQKSMDGLKLKVLFFDLENPNEKLFYDYFSNHYRECKNNCVNLTN
jgi:hypothetical protein